MKYNEFLDWHVPCIEKAVDPKSGSDQKGETSMFVTFASGREKLASMAFALIVAVLFVSCSTSAIQIA